MFLPFISAEVIALLSARAFCSPEGPYPLDPDADDSYGFVEETDWVSLDEHPLDRFNRLVDLLNGQEVHLLHNAAD